MPHQPTPRMSSIRHPSLAHARGRIIRALALLTLAVLAWVGWMLWRGDAEEKPSRPDARQIESNDG